VSVVSDRGLKGWAFGLALALYLTIGYWLQVRQDFILGDALARAAAAQSVIYSRDPHLAAIGFVFTPLTAMVQIPVALLGPVWPEVTARALSGTVMSAVFMAGAVVQVLSLGADRGLARRYLVAIAALFALHPMIVFYGANGMSEAPFIFFTVWTVRRLMLWLGDDDAHHLVAAGAIAMSLAYLTRYDAIACTLAAGLLVGITTYARATEAPRVHRALLDAALVAGPGLGVVMVWAATSWLITGEAFAQFTSQYGNAAILRQSGAVPPGVPGGLLFAAQSTLLLVPSVVALAVWSAVVRPGGTQRLALVVPVTIFGAALIFQALSYAAGSTFPFLRFYIVAVPFAACLAMLCVPDGRVRGPRRRGRYARPPQQPAVPSRRIGYAIPAVLFAVCLPVAGWAMSRPGAAPQEHTLRTVVAGDADSADSAARDRRRIAATFDTERRIAAYLDTLDLPDASVIVDTMYGFAVVAASSRPKVFVIPSDQDFVALLNNPGAAGVRYLLAVPKTGRGEADAVNRRYPTLYETGAEVATLELEIPNDGHNQPLWRLYRVNEPTPAGIPQRRG